MNQLLIATSNQGKFSEFSDMLSGMVNELFSLRDYPKLLLPPESGSTFEANALIKAKYAAVTTGVPALADDSGLEVDYLKGSPGVFSARFAGMAATDTDNNKKLLLELDNVDHSLRSARFTCCIAFCSPDGECVTFSGNLHGSIIEAPRGENGFGYDPLFMVEGYDKTLAELDAAIKNKISHRATAFNKFRDFLASGTR